MTEIGLVLGGGGTRGLAHLGVLKELEPLNIRFEAVSGCSMGAIIGAFYAAGKKPDEVAEFFLRHNLFSFLNLPISARGTFTIEEMQTLMEKFIGLTKFEELKIPLYVNSANLSLGKEVIFSKGDIFKALMASISLPGVFLPLKLNGQYYVDGGVIDNIPFTILPEGIKKYVMVDVSPFRTLESEKKHDMVQILESSLTLMREKNLRLRLERVPKEDYVLIEPDLAKDEVLEHEDHFKAIIEKGRKAARKKIPEIKRLVGL